MALWLVTPARMISSIIGRTLATIRIVRTTNVGTQLKLIPNKWNAHRLSKMLPRNREMRAVSIGKRPLIGPFVPLGCHSSGRKFYAIGHDEHEGLPTVGDSVMKKIIGFVVCGFTLAACSGSIPDFLKSSPATTALRFES